MNNEEILEGNKLIAEFMGYKPCFSHIIDKYNYTQTVDGFLITGKCNAGNHQEDEYENFAIKHLIFHYSWDWLMPVVEKIESISELSLNRKCNFHVTIEKHQCVIMWGISFTISDIYDYNNSKISTVYKSVIEFIKWYNENKL